MEQSPDKPKRRPDIDWLRILIVLLLLYFHTARIFNPLSLFYIKNTQLNIISDYFIFLVDQWLLPILFLISGIATWFSLGYRRGRKYLKERFMRLVVPFIFGMLIIVPPQLYYTLRSNAGYDKSYFQFYLSYFTNFNYQYPFGGDYSGSFELGHLWFLAVLFIFSLILLPFFLYLRRKKGGRDIISWIADLTERGWGILLFALPLVAIEVVLRGLAGWPFLQNPILYFIFFIYGFLLFADIRFEQFIQKYGRIALVGAALCTLILFSMNWQELGFVGERGLAVSAQKYLFETIRGFNMWFWTISALYLAKRYLNFRNKLLQYANDLVLPLYILHQTVIVVLGSYVIQWSAGALVKYFIISTASLVITIIIYDLFIKRTNITRFLFGMRLRGKKK